MGCFGCKQYGLLIVTQKQKPLKEKRLNYDYKLYLKLIFC